DPEEELAGGTRRRALAGGPERRAAKRLLEIAARHARGAANGEAHRGVGAEPRLDLCGELGREPRRGAVVDRAERDPVVVDAEQRIPEREDLESAGVGQNRAVPADEPVQASELRDQLVARTEVQVVRVPEQD